jgi:lipoprotein-anchoring transpeptidase ErfK/SrfK
VAIHGTNEPQLMGQDASNGCIRVTNDIIVQIALEAPLGTPVIIT